MLEQDRSGESSRHEDAIASCSREKGSNHTDDDRAVSYKDRLENGHGQKTRSVSSREKKSIEDLSTRPYGRQQSAAREAIKRAK
ncbi:hypothetical protein N7499_002966 [Penicillium canescens]|uniref:Uncharacterized protein n=1 Tax=Penicillium canescens TaxID=5083 RepID=A0AAD6IBR6_PENCN|nr:uncharacterized protein N7446_011840 [Penicillium canescens]KAJ6019899.1 hypothetical protein N7522_000607 [Penicillium canescens]KAJ6039224.1 hypothetical protein N7460_007256 [Penicillium canescens]KAJ6047006.1 hypothetical protein N7446_011840 [Penicillium canescens]KAJ6060901.1 hypothetical protein N7444_002755 [Penicillium canescens]KAJ6093635.1 hypothetical protein N7499_002966 [Penicillium canescens]